MSPEHRRLTHALLLSLLIHTLLLSLTFGGQGHWLPGFGFPWQIRRIEAPDLRVVLVPPQVTAAEPAGTPIADPLQQASVGQPVARGSAPTPSVSRAPTPRPIAAAIMPEANARAEATPKAETSPKAEERPRTGTATGATPALLPLRPDRPGDTASPPISAPAVIALARTDEATWAVPATPAMPAAVTAAVASAPVPETAMASLRDAADAAQARIDQEPPERAVELASLDPSRQEAQRQARQLGAARQDAARQEVARAENARLEAERQKAALQEAARQEAIAEEPARVEAARQEATRQEAARQEAARQEAARQEAARQEAARQEAARQEAARQEAARQEAARQEAARQEAARQEAAERREAVLRAIGRQLDEEAARRDVASVAARQLPSSSSARRYRLFGRTDPNAEVVLYADAWSRKIELNMTFDMVRELAKQPHNNPVVTVAIRSDGSVESVTFVVPSGVAALDEAIRRVVQSQAPYQVFPPGLARELDVIEIRRTWYFDMAIRLY
jgi:hypothetical protein